MKKPVLLSHQKDAILKVFDSPGEDYWLTLAEISERSAVDFDSVVAVVYRSGEFIEATRHRKRGLPVYTTYKLYRQRTPFWLWLLAACGGKMA